MTDVLIVEDNRSLALVAKSFVERFSEFQAIVTSSREETKSLIKVNPTRFTAAIVDLNLPDAPNGEVIPDVLAANIPVIVMTGSYGEEIRQKMTGYGIVDYIVKQDKGAYKYASELVRRIHKNRSTKALVVEDSKSEASAMQYLMEIQRFNVFVAYSGEQAMQLLHNHPDIRLVITDYNMPGMDGFEFSHRIREIYDKDRLAIIGLSGYEKSRITSRFLKSGANDYLTKGFAYEELLCRVNLNMELLDYIETFQEAAHHDFLTNLFNRRYFFEKGKALYQAAKESGNDLCIAILDIDFFKKVNDTYGHEAGDFALKHLAQMLSETFTNEMLIRLGGEEFCILFQKNAEQASQSLEEFRIKISQSTVDTYKTKFSMTLSIGLTDTLGENIDDMLAIADSALYQAKENGRNCLVYSAQREADLVEFKHNVRASVR
jgi:diguanylate cyclase (GGDEF)-like protein